MILMADSPGPFEFRACGRQTGRNQEIVHNRDYVRFAGELDLNPDLGEFTRLSMRRTELTVQIDVCIKYV